MLAGAFTRLEETNFGADLEEADVTALRIALTAADGDEATRVVRFRAEDEPIVQLLVVQLEAALTGTATDDIRLAALARVFRDNIRPG